MTRRGLLLTMTEPPAAMEEEFNAWHDDEHLAERLATYELDSPQVLTSAEYLARFEGATPWTRRCLGKTVVFKRWACEQVDPGTADPKPLAKALLMVASDTPPNCIALAELAREGTRNLLAPQPGWFMRLYRAYGA